MNVSSVNCFNSQVSCVKQPAFTGYYDVLKNGTKASVKTLKEAENLFGELISEIDKDVMITKTPFFDTIKNIFSERGLKGLFGILSQSTDSNCKVENLVKTVRNENIVQVAKQRGDVLDVTSYSSEPHDIHLGFGAGLKKGYIEFYADKKGNLFVDRTYGDDFISTGLYSDTGTKKVETISYGGGKPDTTYYNKDGTKPFFKNWLFGGTSVEPIF